MMSDGVVNKVAKASLVPHRMIILFYIKNLHGIRRRCSSLICCGIL